jgi:hypothetical protein
MVRISQNGAQAILDVLDRFAVQTFPDFLNHQIRHRSGGDLVKAFKVDPIVKTTFGEI